MTSSRHGQQDKLNADVLRTYADSAIENGKALIEEASLLFQNGHHARAYFLAVAAIEEIGKSILAFDAQGRNLGDPAVATKLSHQMNDHESKIRSAFTGFLAANPRQNLKPAVDLIITLQRGREPAMYTDLNPDLSIQIPSVVVREVTARDCVRLASDCWQSARQHMADTVPAKRSVADDQLFTMKTAHLKDIMKTEDFWWYYIDQMESGKKDFAEAAISYRAHFVLKEKRFQDAASGSNDA